MEPLIAFFGVLAAGGGAAICANALRNPAVDAGAVIASLDGGDGAVDEYTHRLRQPLLVRLVKPLGERAAGALTGLLPSQRIERLRHRLLLAGASGTFGPEEFLVLQGLGGGAGLVLGMLLSVLGGASGLGMLRLGFVFALFGFYVPIIWLNRTRSAREASIREELPDVLDLLAISVEAGVGFEGAIEIVTRHFNGPLAAELARTLREMELGLPRRDTLQNLKRRTEVPELSNFVLILVQADALGMPIGRVLRSQATEIRAKRRQWAREKAAKLPVKILVPLVLFIFPAMFVILLGPAAFTISRNFL